MEYQELLDFVHSLRDDITKLKSELEARPSKKRKVEEKVPCKGLTNKGGPCRNHAICGSEFCKMHGENNTRPEKVKKVTTPKPKKIVPRHCHPCGSQFLGSCSLCQTHGDVLNPGLPDDEFVGEDDETLSQTLRALWSAENQ